MTAARVSVIVPHAGIERVPLLRTTLITLRQRPGVGEIVIAELGEFPSAGDIAARWADKHLFITHRGAFERARALNAGSAIASYSLILWHDNDLLISTSFITNASRELRSRALDHLIPYTSIRYLSKDDSRMVMRGTRTPLDCKPINVFSGGRGAPGGLALVTHSFFERTGGLVEGFRGWGGEDDAWNHKAALLGRSAPTVRRDQHAHHLWHPTSGGVAPGVAARKNPHYSANRKLLRRICAARRPQHFQRQYPSVPQHSGVLTLTRSVATVPARAPTSDLTPAQCLGGRLSLALESLGVRSLVDVACGKIDWIAHVRLGLDRYIGVDIHEQVVVANRTRYADNVRTFTRLDVVNDPIPAADAVLCRNLLPTLSFREICIVLCNIRRSGAKYLLTTTFAATRYNKDVSVGGWRPLNLTLPPFNFPATNFAIDELSGKRGRSFDGKRLGVWLIADLPCDRYVSNARECRPNARGRIHRAAVTDDAIKGSRGRATFRRRLTR